MVTVTKEERQKIREAAHAVKLHAFKDSLLAPLMDWQLQTSNSYRRIGQCGDGDVLCATTHPQDRQPDLLAAPGVLDYIVAVQPRIVLALLDRLDELEGDAAILEADLAGQQVTIEGLENTIAQAASVGAKVNEIELRVAAVTAALLGLAEVVGWMAGPTNPAVVRSVLVVVEQLDRALRGDPTKIEDLNKPSGATR